MSVNNYIKETDSLNPIAGRASDEKVDKTSILNTLEEIEASTSPLNVAGANVIQELFNKLSTCVDITNQTTGVAINGYKVYRQGYNVSIHFSGVTTKAMASNNENMITGLPKAKEYEVQFLSLNNSLIRVAVAGGSLTNYWQSISNNAQLRGTIHYITIDPLI